ncbi:hypothetical protein MFLO_15875 [Listeria floridensis FSL S10-1187]|uniref:Uncharacterized protein n=1 Tax=Listeria floridensis FSL S10-1187 TaxID=1265817 RepID=A0ABN0RBA6_9LIST|nr:hypothetical protein [Listeria floridensis]EUJ23493.1 hypothetical protein MFLO_15875 [Listeria floridensis FSL S10-1187]
MRYKYYDYKKAQHLIKSALSENHDLHSAYLVMKGDLSWKGDWSWTEEEIWNKETGFLVDLNKKDLKIAGINYSYLYTPTLELFFWRRSNLLLPLLF